MYVYEEQRANLFDDHGQRKFLQIRDKVKGLLKRAGAVRMQEAIGGFTGDSWQMLACVDRMVELGELVEVTDPTHRAGQHRIFVRGPHG